MKDENKSRKELLSELKALKRKVRRLEGEAQNAKEANEELSRDHRILDAISKLQGSFIFGQDTKVTFTRMLNDILRLTHSEYGFIGEVHYTSDNTPFLKTRAISDISWDKESRKLYREYEKSGMEFKNLATLFGSVLRNGRAVISNNPSRDRRRGGNMPKGHPALKAFMGIPITISGNLIGMIGVANRPEGYDRKLLTRLKPVVATCAALIEAFRLERERAVAVQEAREAHVALKNVLEEIAEPVIVVERDYTVTLMNRAARQFYNVSEKKLTRQKNYCYALSHRLNEPCGLNADFACPKDEVFRTGQPTGLTHIHSDRNGRPRHVSILATPVKDSAGKITGMVETFRDVTEYKEMETALAESEELFRTAFGHAAIGMAIISPAGRFLESNRAFQNMAGCSASEMTEIQFLDLVHPEEREQDREMFKRALNGEMSHYVGERRFMQKGGAEVWGRLSATMIYGLDGSARFMIAMVENITARKYAETALKDREERFRRIFEDGPLGMAIFHGDSFMQANHTFCSMTGYTEEELRDMTFLDITHPDRREKDRKKVQSLMAGETPVLREEKQYVRKNGSLFWGAVTATVVRDSEGAYMYTLAMVEDITERKRVQEELSYNKDFLQSIIDAEPECVKLLDSECRLVRMNPSGVAMVEAEDEQPLIGNDVSQIVDEQYRADFREFTRRVCAGESGRLLFRITGLKGTKRWLESYAVPFFDKGTGKNLLLGVTRDITERRRMEEDLKHAEAEWRNTFDSISDFVSVHDSDFRIVRANKALAALFEKEPRDIIGMPCYELFHGTSEPKSACPHKRMMEEKRAITEEVFEEKIGVPLLVTASPIYSEEGDIIGSVHICKDITALKMIEDDLRQSLDEKELLIKEVHHRIKNNLNIISSLLRLQSREVEDQKTKGLFTESQNRVNTMSLIHEKLYRSENLSSVDFSEYLRELVVHVFRSFEMHPGVNLRLEVTEASLDIDCLIPCALILNELVSNALKYAFPEERAGELFVGFSSTKRAGSPEEESWYELVVRDDGAGLPEDFDLNSSRTLGMQIVTSLAAQLEGEVDLKRLSPGTEFRISFVEKAFKKRR